MANPSSNSTKPSTWSASFLMSEIPVGRARVAKLEGKQLAVVRPTEDEVYAIDNRCPHEGYPLAQGKLIGGTLLMCRWHNFTFDLRSGRCIGGDEDVRWYPTRVVEGRVEIDLANLDSRLQAARYFESLERGLLERKMGQAARDVVRLLEVGVSAEELIARIVAFDAAHGEFGPNHALPVAADALPLLERHKGLEATLPIMLVADIATERNAGRLARDPEAPIDPGVDPAATSDRLVDAAKGYRLKEVEGLIRGALAKGWGREVIEPWLFRLASSNFKAFGHGLIFHVKAFDLLERIGWEHAADTLPALAMITAAMPREEEVPVHAGFRKQMAVFELELTAWAQKQGTGTLGASAAAAIRVGALDGNLDEALDAVADALRGGAPADAIAGVLCIAGAERMLRYDLAVERDPSVQEGWLDVTHLVTYANSVRTCVRWHPDADGLRGLFFASWFIHKMQPLDQPAASRAEPIADEGVPALNELMSAIAAHDNGNAHALAVRYLKHGGDVQALRIALEDLSLGDHGTRPIFIAHFLKTTVAAFDDWATLPNEPDRDLLLLAVVRFLASPIAERGVASATEDAIRFVRDGIPPQRLTP